MKLYRAGRETKGAGQFQMQRVVYCIVWASLTHHHCKFVPIQALIYSQASRRGSLAAAL